MAQINIKFLATSVMMQMHFLVFLPDGYAGGESALVDSDEKLKVLWLLHGEGGDCSDWLRLTRLERYAEKANLAIVMPNMDNSEYMNMAHGRYPYFTYLTEQLMDHVFDMLPILSRDKKDNFAAGNLTGGYGAIKWALTKPDAFAAAASISGAVDMVSYMARAEAEGTLAKDKLVAFGSSDYIKDNSNDILYLASAVGEAAPELFIYNADSDADRADNAAAAEKLTAAGLKVTFEHEPGVGDWELWEDMMKRFIDRISGR